MSERETVLLREFKDKLDKVIDLHLKVKNENIMLREELSAKKEHMRLLTIQNEELVKKLENLKFARSLTGADNDSRDAKIKINKIVREIDQCIAMLNK
jgi:hypothetical protein